MSTALQMKVTEDEYLQGEITAKEKHEFVNGEAFAMAGASEKHNIISGNFFAELYIQLKGKPCTPFIADMKVSTQGDFYYPDVMIVCDQHENDTDYVKYAPKLIVEVLSKSTRVFDHSIKQAKYLKIPSLEYYLLIEQDFCEIQLLSRAERFIPKYYYLGDEINFTALDVTISVTDIYDRIDNEDTAAYVAAQLAQIDDV